MAETKNGSDTHSIESATTVGSAAGNKENKGLHYLKNFIGSTLRRDKNEPTRFLGDGVSFKAKLIGILEVSEARGDRMCQEALSDLKTAIRAAGEHKQRIIINIAIDGLRLRDEKTGDCLYHHPVHKISFIAQDMSDSRAFGYIFGSPDTGHRFFGIKTDKAASQVVITMRDLFQVVFELKKKEIEMAKQHIEQHQLKYSSVLFSEISNKSTDTLKMRPMLDDRLKDCSGTSERGENNQEHIMDLLDLELELNNIQLGINQMDRITPSDPFGPTAATKAAAAAAAAASSHDPFGDSFNPLSSSSSTRAKIPPPPDTGKSTSRLKMTEKHWFDHETEALFEETELPSSVSYLQSGPSTQRQASESPLPVDQTVEEANSRRTSSPQKVQFDVFTDLDPLGTGRSKPYVDKKDFFQDLKNPPKKVLKDLVTELPLDSKQSALTSSESDAYLTSESHLTSEPNSDSTKPTSAAPQLFSNAFPDDPFDKDPFTEVDFSPSIFTPTGNDPFEKFANFDSFKTSREADKIQKICKEKESKPVPLKVSLPPEKISTIDGGSTLSPLSLRKSKLQKASSLSCVIKPPSPKPKFRSKLAAQTSSEVFSDDGLKKASSLYASIPDSASAPEPPPRSAINSFNMKPPPLPPKRVTATISTKPPFKPPNSDYDYIENYQSTTYADVNSPPLPAPARKLRNTSKSSLDQDYYLQPFPLLPPPKKKNAKPSASPPVANKCSVPSDKSLDITLSQLTKTGFSDLAAMLNMSPTSLSKMTLQDLTVCLAKLSNEAQSRNNGPTSGDSVIQSGILNSQCYSALRESIDEESSNFKAEFDVHFRTDSKKEEEESLFDKYAVFRELLEEEKKQSGAIIDKVNGEPSADGESVKIVAPSEDRYAALRDICLDEVTEEKFEDLSDKEDSIIEPSRLEEDTDLLPQSRAHSESTESPTITLKEHQSIMEATIMEEDNSALDGDEDVPEEVVEEVKPSTPSQHRLSPKQRSKTLMNERSNVEKPNSDVQSSWAKFESAPIPVGENAASVHAEGHMSSWSNDSKDNELPSASRDKKKQRKIKRYKQSQWQEDEESEEGWEGRPDHNSWSPSWRENGWSDGDSLYDETPPYIERDYHSPRRGRRRRISPWNSREQSPWEEDDHELSEDQWEGSRWQDEPRQRPKHRGQSWEEDRRRYYMDFMDEHRKSRKPMSWTNDLDRKSSRESLNWEDEERYQKRNYMERRRRKWDDDGHNRNRSWREREWTDPGGKMNNRYYKERVHDPHWDGDYGEPFDDDKSRWSQRPRSCDRARRQFVNHTLESEFQDRRYMRARDTPSDVDYRRKTQAPPSQKQRRKHNQSSPFEDDFSTQFGFSKNSISGPDDATEEVSIRTQSHKKPPFTEPFHEFTQYPSHTSSHCSQDYPRESSTPNTARSYQQSPFEDDFTSNEVRRSSGRSASSELSDHKCNEDTFFPSPSNSTKTKHSTSANQVEVKTDNAASQSKDVSVNTTDSHFRNKLGSSQLSSDSDFKQEPPSRRIFKNSDSSSSLCKSESVNIFARKNDPFDDDFFCEGSADSQDDKTPK